MSQRRRSSRSPAYRQHYPGNQISAEAWCRKCKKDTQHKISGHRLSNVCIPCQEKAETEHQARLLLPPQPVQKGLFA